MIPHFDKTSFEIATEEGTHDDVNVYELHLTPSLICGLFIWPRDWEWTWGFFPGLFNAAGSILHIGPLSLGYYRSPL